MLGSKLTEGKKHTLRPVLDGSDGFSANNGSKHKAHQILRIVWSADEKWEYDYKLLEI